MTADHNATQDGEEVVAQDGATAPCGTDLRARKR